MDEQPIYPELRITKLLVRDIRGEALSEAEANELRTWIDQSEANRQLYNEFHDANWRDKTFTRLERFDEGAALERIRQSIDERSPGRQAVQRRLWPRLATAAALVLLLTFSYVYRSEIVNQINPVTMQEAVTAQGEREELTLDDGTKVWLAPGSSLSYPDRFRGENRKVNLTGEAFFEVVSDSEHPFIIHSGNITTKVTGTTFNVRAYRDDKELAVTLVSGKVTVASTTSTGNRAVELAPNERAVFDQQQQRLIKEDYPQAADLIARREGHFKYSGAPLSELIADMKRTFNLDIEVSGSVEGCTFYGEKRPQDDVYDFLEHVGIITHKTIQKQGSKIIISGDACRTRVP